MVVCLSMLTLLRIDDLSRVYLASHSHQATWDRLQIPHHLELDKWKIIIFFKMNGRMENKYQHLPPKSHIRGAGYGWQWCHLWLWLQSGDPTSYSERGSKLAVLTAFLPKQRLGKFSDRVRSLGQLTVKRQPWPVSTTQPMGMQERHQHMWGKNWINVSVTFPTTCFQHRGKCVLAVAAAVCLHQFTGPVTRWT